MSLQKPLTTKIWQLLEMFIIEPKLSVSNFKRGDAFANGDHDFFSVSVAT
jgi:hypothetical protein